MATTGATGSLFLKTVWAVTRRVLIFFTAIFLPAWSLDYWQAWLFLAVFFVPETMLVAYLFLKDKELLQRRLKAGGSAETRPRQKLIMRVAAFSFLGIVLVAGLDHRHHWSQVPIWLVCLADTANVAGLYLTFRVFHENTFAASTVQITDGQKVISTGPYAVVRHPMYSAAVVMNLGIPIALGSWWSVLFSVLNLCLIAVRLLDEETMLRQDMPGYPDYCAQVRYRLIPGVW